MSDKGKNQLRTFVQGKNGKIGKGRTACVDVNIYARRSVVLYEVLQVHLSARVRTSASAANKYEDEYVLDQRVYSRRETNNAPCEREEEEAKRDETSHCVLLIE